MVCGGFICTKNALCALNILYVLVSLLLIGVAAWGKWFGLVSSIRVVAGVIGVGIFLFLVAFVGLCGALKHHQVLLFFYMMILFIVFVVQFSVSCACLALNKDQQNHLLEVGWNKSEATQKDVEKTLDCCGFSYINYNGSCAAVSKSSAISFSFSSSQQVDLDLHDHVSGSYLIFSLTSSSARDAFITLYHLVRCAPTSSRSMRERCFSLWVVSDSSSVLQRSLEFGSPTDTEISKILDQILEPFYDHSQFNKPK
ncbi:tetraspanin-13a isoform X1 [Siniperca chuatsi]|uniref:tetraspanin-13a isoform X1 n=1 Tax=Siniperca chuatsi TaxID=119488 RepID=UPI001CE0CAE4|nr:tetraspanin-13a isoform X1 [Siniperca chuatsi]